MGLCVFVHNQLIADALLMYGIDMKHLSDLAQHDTELKSLASHCIICC